MDEETMQRKDNQLEMPRGQIQTLHNMDENVQIQYDNHVLLHCKSNDVQNNGQK